VSTHTLDEALARYRLGFYPYFDRKHNAFYWDRAESRAVIPLSAEVDARASLMLADSDPSIEVYYDHQPQQVITDLADETLRSDTWVKSDVVKLYRMLVQSGHGHTIEAYDTDGALVGGLLFVLVGRAVLAETMYRKQHDASRKCLSQLALDRRRVGSSFIDVQVSHSGNHPVHRLGEQLLTLENYLRALDEAAGSSWPRPAGDIRSFALFPPTRSAWAETEAKHVKRAQGETLIIGGFQAMQSWEDPLMKAMADSVSGAGKFVLEVGYGLGISAGYIQEHGPRVHVIVEANRVNAEAARARYAGAIAKGSVVVIQGFWQDAVSSGQLISLAPRGYDGILFDVSPTSDGEIHRAKYDFFPHVEKLLAAQTGRFTYFSDEINEIPTEHLERLRRAFGAAKIETSVIPVAPWSYCEYWSARTILHVVVNALGSSR
jgi:guanidinoacetate N-methyltransferase